MEERDYQLVGEREDLQRLESAIYKAHQLCDENEDINFLNTLYAELGMLEGVGSLFYKSDEYIAWDSVFDVIDGLKEKTSKGNSVRYILTIKVSSDGDYNQQLMAIITYFKNRIVVEKYRESGSEKWEAMHCKSKISQTQVADLAEMSVEESLYAYIGSENPDFLSLAAKSGNAEAQYMYSQRLFFSDRKKEALEWLLKAAGNGHREAQFEVAQKYAQIDVDIKTEAECEAEKMWMMRAADAGHKHALRDIVCSLYGEEAMNKYLLKAAEAGDTLAYHKLGTQAYNAEKYEEAAHWWVQEMDAMLDGKDFTTESIIRLGEMFYEGKGINQDYVKALQCWKYRSADKTFKLMRQMGIAPSQERAKVLADKIWIEKCRTK